MRFKPSPDQIRSWVIDNFPEYKERKQGQQLVIRSPFLTSDKLKFNINVEEGICHDWRGDEWANGKNKSFLKFVQLYRGCSFGEAVREVCGQSVSLKTIYARIGKKDEEVDQEQAILELPHDTHNILTSPYSKMAGMLRKWLHSRGINDDMIKRYDICHSVGEVVWPYYEYDMLVYWQSRDIINKFFKYPPDSIGVTKGMFLYGFDMVEPSDYMIITEAIIDSMTVGDQCTASGGATLSDGQIKKIHAINPVRGIILAPDNDMAGIKSLLYNYNLLCDDYKIYYSIPQFPEIEKETGEDIKDWNKLGEVIGFDKVREHFESKIRPLTQTELFKLSRITMAE